MNTHFLDVRRLLCPLPVIRTQDKVKTLNSQDILEITGTDPGMLQDIPSWCRINGHQVLETSENNAIIVIRIQVG